MNIEIDYAASNYRRYIFDVVNGVQEAREIREKAFTESEYWARELTRLLKGHEQVPKKHLYAIYSAAGILENEAPNSKHERRVMEIVSAIRLTFAMILTDSCHDECKPSQPGMPNIG